LVRERGAVEGASLRFLAMAVLASSLSPLSSSVFSAAGAFLLTTATALALAPAWPLPDALTGVGPVAPLGFFLVLLYAARVDIGTRGLSSGSLRLVSSSLEELELELLRELDPELELCRRLLPTAAFFLAASKPILVVGREGGRRGSVTRAFRLVFLGSSESEEAESEPEERERDLLTLYLRRRFFLVGGDTLREEEPDEEERLEREEERRWGRRGGDRPPGPPLICRPNASTLGSAGLGWWGGCWWKGGGWLYWLPWWL